MGFKMGSFFTPGHDYGVQELLFALSVVLLTLPLAALIAASIFDGLMRQRPGRGHLAPVPLSLRRSRQLEQPRFGRPERAF